MNFITEGRRDYYALTIERLAILTCTSFLSWSNNVPIHHDGYGQVKNYNESIHNLSLQNQVNIFQYTNILHHKNIAKFHKKF